MTLDTLTATEAEFGSEAAFMREMTDRYAVDFTPVTDFTKMFLAGALADLRLQLPQYVRAPLSWTGYNVSIARVADVPSWRYLVSRMQLVLFYEWLDQGEGSLNRQKLTQYRKDVRAALTGIIAVINGSGGTSVTRTGKISL